MPVSSVIRHIFYRPEKEELSVWFSESGRRYKYYGVPAELYEDFRNAESRGKFYNAHVKGRYECELIDDPARKGRKFTPPVAHEPWWRAN